MSETHTDQDFLDLSYSDQIKDLELHSKNTHPEFIINCAYCILWHDLVRILTDFKMMLEGINEVAQLTPIDCGCNQVWCMICNPENNKEIVV